MKLSLVRPFLSIATFATVDLPPFTVITGANGAGKTHLLKGIKAGAIRVELDGAVLPHEGPSRRTRPPKPSELPGALGILQQIQHLQQFQRPAVNQTVGPIQLFDWTLAPNKTPPEKLEALYVQRDRIAKSLQKGRNDHVLALRAAIEKHRLEYAGDPWTYVASLRATDLAGHVEPGMEARVLRELTQPLRSVWTAATKSAQSDDAALAYLNALKATHGDLAATLVESDLDSEYGTVDLFRQNFARLFLAYSEKDKQNVLRRVAATERGDGVDYLSDVEFRQKHGEPPWTFVNKVLQGAGLDFAIDQPPAYNAVRYDPRLTKNATGVEVQFDELSSGERVLMSFAFCLYQSLDGRQAVRRPALLLFDEVDASLHPSMTRTIVDIIRNTIVAEHGVPVIMTTHSPSTIAVIPEESTYVMESPGGLRKVGKRQAISILTSGIPTLSIAYESRRQVLVESDRDASRFDALYQRLAPSLNVERSITFIGVGRKPVSGADQNAGCEHVKKLVRGLASHGNESVFGLVDWDTRNVPEERICVLAHGRRHSIENVLLDPLLVAATVARCNPNVAQELRFTQNEGFTALASLGEERLQQVADAVQESVLGDQYETTSPRVRCTYQNGRTVSVVRRYLEMRGHDLAERVLQAFPCLTRFSGQEKLLEHVVETVLLELPGLCPTEISDAFRSLLEALPPTNTATERSGSKP